MHSPVNFRFGPASLPILHTGDVVIALAIPESQGLIHNQIT